MFALLLLTCLAAVSVCGDEFLGGITKDDIKEVRRSWALIYRKKALFRNDLFEIFIEMYPEYTKYFSKFKTDKYSSLLDNPEFIRLMEENVMKSINDVVKNLDKRDILMMILNNIATSQAKRNVKIKQLEAFGKALMHTIENALKLDPDSNAKTEETWANVINAALNHIGRVTGE